MNRIMLFAGTSEGHQLCECLKKEKKETVVYVATEYGEEVLTPLDLPFPVITGRINQLQMLKELEEEQPSVVIDATHPYALLVSENIKSACENKNIPYIRVVRQSLAMDSVISMNHMEEIVSYLNRKEGNIFVTTGSKEIHYFTQINSYENRIFARILPDKEAVSHCIGLGIKGKHLICMQGPFSKELNYALLKEFKIEYLVTKESGSQGGFLEKVKAAKEAGVTVIVLRRPLKESGFLLEEVIEMIRKGEVR